MSPCDGVPAPHREKARDRVLTDDELIAIFNTAGQMGGAFGAIGTQTQTDQEEAAERVRGVE